jgi:phage protein, HK97 gp10 family
MIISQVTVEDHSEELLAEIREKMPAILESVGQAGENNAKFEITALGAIDTGNLRNSISHTDDGNYAYIGTNVEYAPYVEMGTVKMQERPFLRNAVLNHQNEYKALFEEGLKS